MPVARLGDRETYYEVHGEGEPLLCVMGLAADTLGWALQIPSWSKRFRVIVFDNRDVGRSSYADGDYEVADMAADALALADELGLDSFHLVGLSMGGAIAQQIALAAPQRVRTLTLVVTYAGWGRLGRDKAAMWIRDAADRSREERIDELLMLVLSEETYENERLIGFLRQVMLDNPNPQRPDGFARQLAASRRHDARDRLGELGMPVHVVGAEQDILVPVWKSRELARLVPDAKLTVLEGAGHGVNLERADDFNALVLDFIAGQSGVGAGRT